MEVTLRSQPRTDGAPGQDHVIEGDTGFFFWLLTAAGNARDGFEGNFANCTDGSGDRIALQPAQPLERGDQNWRSRTAHVTTPAPIPPKPTVGPPPGTPAVTTEPTIAQKPAPMASGDASPPAETDPSPGSRSDDPSPPPADPTASPPPGEQFLTSSPDGPTAPAES